MVQDSIAIPFDKFRKDDKLKINFFSSKNHF